MRWVHHRRSNLPYAYKACWNRLYPQPLDTNPQTLRESNVLARLYAGL